MSSVPYKHLVGCENNVGRTDVGNKTEAWPLPKIYFVMPMVTVIRMTVFYQLICDQSTDSRINVERRLSSMIKLYKYNRTKSIAKINYHNNESTHQESSESWVDQVETFSGFTSNSPSRQNHANLYSATNASQGKKRLPKCKLLSYVIWLSQRPASMSVSCEKTMQQEAEGRALGRRIC